jgi:NhaP-type Na+/H+ or K+/H+ antiporter
VAVAMALSLPADIPQRALLQEITFGVVLFTLLVQGTTVGWVVDRAIGAPTTGDGPAGEAPTGQAPARQAPTGPAPAGEATGEVPA